MPEHSNTTSTARGDCRSGSQGGIGLELGRVEHLGRTEIGGQAPAALAGLHHDHRAQVHGRQRGDGERADGPGPEDHGRVTGDDARPGDAVQRHRQGLGQRGHPGRHPVGQRAAASGRR